MNEHAQYNLAELNKMQEKLNELLVIVLNARKTNEINNRELMKRITYLNKMIFKKEVKNESYNTKTKNVFGLQQK